MANAKPGNARDGAKIPLSEGKSDPESASAPPEEPPLARKVRDPKTEFLSRELNGKPIATSRPTRGRQRRKTKGPSYDALRPRGYKALTRRDLRREYDPEILLTYEQRDEIARSKAKPIGPVARELVADFLRRESFWRFVVDWGIAVAIAGPAVLGVKARRAQQVLDELKADGGPRAWFCKQAEQGIRSGRIVDGMHAAHEPIADLFFDILVGGREGLKDARARAAAGATYIEAGQAVANVAFVEVEAINYTVTRYFRPNGGRP